MQFALIAAGRVNASFVARLPRLAVRLGPVAAQSYRLASRIVNTLGAGHAVKDYAALTRTRVILICVAPAGLAGVAARLGKCEIRGRVVLLCDCERDSSAIGELAAQGAAIGSLSSVPGAGGWMALEGQKAALREANELARELHANVVEVTYGRMDRFAAGVELTATQIRPLLDRSAELFRSAGLAPRTTTRLLEAVFESSLRAYVRAGRRPKVASR